jgi:predicted metal-dependent phosphoesterase TrpH
LAVDSGREERLNGKPGIADLHIHSTYSDGVYSPCELVSKAAELGLDTISITDHDCVTGVDEAVRCAGEFGVNVISGIELSASLNGREVHILGYFFDSSNPELLATVSYLRDERIKRAERIVNKLNRLKIPITMESVLRFSGAGSVGRPHIARAVVEGGFAETYLQVFAKYISDGGPAYEKKVEYTPQTVINLIAKAGGLSVLAHPGRTVSENDILALIQAGIDGIEVIHPSHAPELVRHYRAIVSQYYLVESGGSDFHGGLRADDQSFGQVYVTLDIVNHMRRRLPHRFQ